MKLIINESKTSTLLPKVMKSSVKLFVQKGIEGTTIKDIARDANVSVGALYNHYKGKEELAWHIFTSHLQDFTEELSKVIDPLSSVREKLKMIIHACFTAFEEQRDLFVYLIVSEHRELRHYPRDKNHPGNLIRSFVSEGQKSGEIKKGTSAVLGALILGSIIRTCLLRMYGTLDRDLRHYEDEMLEAVWNAVKIKE